MASSDTPVYASEGFCPICEKEVVFTSRSLDFRSHLQCPTCINKSVPRERAIALIIKRVLPDWKTKLIHESSPVNRAFSALLKLECKGYFPTQYFPGEKPGQNVRGFRNENLEHQTFEDNYLDASISLDVFEHVNDPERAFFETSRTLKPGGHCIFTVPTYAGKIKSERRAKIFEDGSEEIILGPPEYHGNPVNSKGALVTFQYGYDLPEMIYKWSKMRVELVRFYNPYYGLIGRMTEVYVCTK